MNVAREHSVSIGKEGWPIASLVACLLLVAASVLPLLVFTLETGRYVPTGAVLGFEGYSYFYTSGLPPFIATILWLPAILCNFKNIAISTSKDGLTFVERRLGREKKESLQLDAIKAVLVRNFPRSKVLAWLVIWAPYLALNLQLAIANLGMPFMSGPPLPAITLFACLALVVGALLVVAIFPGVKITVHHATGKLSVNLQGALNSKEIAGWMNVFFESAGLERPPISDAREKPGASKLDVVATLVVPLLVLACSLAGVVLILTVSEWVVLNQASAWGLILFSIIVLIERGNKDNGYLRNMHVGATAKAKVRRAHYFQPVWFKVIAIATLFFTWYPIGNGIAHLATAPAIAPRMLVLVAIAGAFLAWVFCLAQRGETAVEVEVSATEILQVRPFKAKVIRHDRVDEGKRAVVEKAYRTSFFPIFSFVIMVIALVL